MLTRAEPVVRCADGRRAGGLQDTRETLEQQIGSLPAGCGVLIYVEKAASEVYEAALRLAVSVLDRAPSVMVVASPEPDSKGERSRVPAALTSTAPMELDAAEGQAAEGPTTVAGSPRASAAERSVACAVSPWAACPALTTKKEQRHQRACGSWPRQHSQRPGGRALSWTQSRGMTGARACRFPRCLERRRPLWLWQPETLRLPARPRFL